MLHYPNREENYRRRNRPRRIRRKEIPFKPDRRRFLKSLGVVGIILFLGGRNWLSKLIFSKEPEHKKEEKEILKEINEKLEKIENEKSFNPDQEITVNLDSYLEEFIKTNYLSDLIEKYFNKDNKINPYKILENLWDAKISIVENNDKKKFFEKLKSAILESYKQNPGAKIDLKKFFEYLELCLGESLLLIDFEKISREFNFSEDQKTLAQILFQDEEFIKYLKLALIIIILNEISFCSKENPEINLIVLEYLISNFGINFISCIPAVYDEELSFGPFQLTDRVVGENTSDANYPITKINECLKDEDEFRKYQLPTNLENFRNRDHYLGEIFLIYYFLCRYIKKLDKQRISNLITMIQNREEKRKEVYNDLLMMICACHHGGESNLKEFLKPESKRSFNEKVETYLEKAKLHLNFFS